MVDKWTDLATQVDTMIRQSKVAAARALLVQIIPREIPRSMVALMARLTRRTRMNYLTLRILKPIIQAEALFSTPATEEELALYAGALIRVGGRKQGLKILAELNSDKNPEIFLFQMDAYFSEWNYLKAIPLLKKYLKSPLINNYQKLIGQLNLAAAYVFEGRLGPALDLLVNIRADCKFKGYHLLYANSLELSAQISLAQKKFQQAHCELELASTILGNEKGIYQFFLKKWIAIGNFMENPLDPNGIKNFDALRFEAQEMQDWEGVRQIDFYQALITDDSQLYLRWMASTPYKNYRKILRQKFKNPPALPLEFRIRRGGLIDENVPSLNITSACFANSQLRTGGLVHRLLILLSHDFYRPLPLGEVFSRLYEDEYFDSETSPDRVRSVAKRLSAWFIEQKIPLSIQTNRQSLSLCALGPIDLVISNHDEEISRGSCRLDTLRNKIKSKWFSVAEATLTLGLSLRSTQRVLTLSIEQGDLKFQGKGRARRYRFMASLQHQYHK